MTLARTFCVPPDLARAVIAKCSDTALRGLATAPDVTLDELLDDIQAKRAMLWLVLEGTEPLATALTEILYDDKGESYVAIFGLGGKNMWKWARSFAEAIVDYAKAGTKPSATDGLTFFNTGVNLVTDKPAAGVTSIDSTKGTELCWG